MAKEIKSEAQRQEAIEAGVSKTEQFYQENKKSIWGIVGGVVVISLLILGYQKLIREPKVAEAMEQTYPAERVFRDGNFELALNGDGNILGFAQIIDEYGALSGKAVYLYAGICSIRLGDNEQAIAYLKKYNGKDPILAARALGLQGDAYVNLEQYQKAADMYGKAVAKADNMYAAAYILKQGQVFEALGQKDKALKCYETVKDKYPESYEAYQVNSLIGQIKVAE